MIYGRGILGQSVVDGKKMRLFITYDKIEYVEMHTYCKKYNSTISYPRTLRIHVTHMCR